MKRKTIYFPEDIAALLEAAAEGSDVPESHIASLGVLLLLRESGEALEDVLRKLKVMLETPPKEK